ncbi:MAG: hypothetical protein BMS9Abin33_0288 [Gammaproteobacteria bacterium]|nr:MAG: hypothetical protein BMS9Abin33_0288 [Gammaproteobacteria bacterium]
MPTAQERAKALAKQVMAAMKQARAAETRAITLGEEMKKALLEAKAEAEAAARVVIYPSGRYECTQCGESVLFTEESTDLPECAMCGSRSYKGHAPRVLEQKRPPPKKYPAGMYQCTSCSARVAVAVDTNELSACDLCGQDSIKAVD